MSSDPTNDHQAHDHVVARFPDRDRAEAAVADLREHGLGSEHLGVAVHGTDTVVFEHDDQADVVHGMETGAVGGILGLSAVTAGWGAFLGAYAGIGAGDRAGESHAELEQLSLEPGEVLVVACRHEPSDDLGSVMERHGGRLHTPT